MITWVTYAIYGKLREEAEISGDFLGQKYAKFSLHEKWINCCHPPILLLLLFKIVMLNESIISLIDFTIDFYDFIKHHLFN